MKEQTIKLKLSSITLQEQFYVVSVSVKRYFNICIKENYFDENMSKINFNNIFKTKFILNWKFNSLLYTRYILLIISNPYPILVLFCVSDTYLSKI